MPGLRPRSAPRTSAPTAPAAPTPATAAAVASTVLGTPVSPSAVSSLRPTSDGFTAIVTLPKKQEKNDEEPAVIKTLGKGGFLLVGSIFLLGVVLLSILVVSAGIFRIMMGLGVYGPY